MSSTLINLYKGQPGSSNTTLYTCPPNTRVRILAATIINEGTTSRYMSMHMVDAAGTAQDTNIVLNQKVVGSRASYIVNELIGHVLEAGDFLSAIAEAADKLTVHISGVAIV